MYIRLSREDGDKQESESIGNQRKIIERYLKEQDLNIVHEPIIDKDIFEKAQIIHKERVKKVVKQYDYLLRGLIYCKHCRLANANCIKSKTQK